MTGNVKVQELLDKGQGVDTPKVQCMFRTGVTVLDP